MRRRSTHHSLSRNVPFIRLRVICGIGCALVVVWYLVMVTSSVGASYRLRDLAQSYATVKNEQETLEGAVEGKLIPQNLARGIETLGMVQIAAAEYVTVRGQDAITAAKKNTQQQF